MKKLFACLLFVFSTGLSAVPGTCVLYYPKECKPVLDSMQISFHCPAGTRKLETRFSIMNLFTSAYMPETLKFIPHNLNHFVWECLD